MKISVELDLDIERDQRINWVIMNWYRLEQDVQEARDFAAVQPGTNGWGKGPKGRIDLSHHKSRRFDEIINKIFGVPE